MTASTGYRVGRGLAGAAVLIAVVTAAARVLGFGRWLVFAHTVRTGCLGDAYNTANMVPNIVFEIVAGGALAGVVVPLLAGPLARTDRHDASRTVSALLTWTLLVLVPVTLLAVLLARPVASALLHSGGGGCGAEFAAVVGRMLLVFLPQIPLYGVAVVLSGLLQADRRFLAPALAPLLSSLVVLGAYGTFGVLYGGGGDLAGLPRHGELVLSVGTTAGVLVLAASLLPAARSVGLRLRPTLTFPPGLAARARGLAGAGIATLVAQQLATLAVLALANSRYGDRGALTVYTYTWAVYLLPYAVLAVPIATSAFSALSARVDAGDTDGYRTTVATTTRAVLLASCAGAGVLAATALPVARVFLAATGSAVPPVAMASALLAFAPGLLGYGLVAHLGRALYAAGRGRAAAMATVVGWVGVIAVDVVLVAALPPRLTVAAFGLGNTVGMLVAAVLLLLAIRRSAGAGSLAGLPRSGFAGVAGALAAWAVASGVSAAMTSLSGAAGPVASVPVAVLAALVASGVFGVVVLLLDGADLRLVLRRLVLKRRFTGV